MKNILVIFLFFHVTIIFGQYGLPSRPYEKINFQNFHQIWYETNFVESVKNDSLDGYNHLVNIENLEPLIYDNKVVISYRQKGPNHVFYGTYISCYDLITGTKLWSQEFGHFSGQHQEIVRLMYVEEEKLVAITQVNKNPFDKKYTKLFYPDMALSKKIFDLTTGHLISNTQRPFNDSLSYNTTADFGLVFTRNFLYKENQNIRYITPQYQNTKSYIKSVLIDTTGLLISEDTLGFKNFNYYFNFAQIHEDTLISVQFMDNPNSIVFHYLSPQLKLYRSVYSPYIFDHLPAKINLIKVSEDKSKVLFYNQRNEFYPDDYMEIYVFDLIKGELLRKISLKEVYYFDGVVLNWDTDLDTVIIFHGQLKERKNSNDYYSTLNVFKVNHLDSMFLYDEYIPTDTLRAGFPYDIVSVSESKFIMFFHEYGLIKNQLTNRITYDDNALAQSMMLIDTKNIVGSTIFDGFVIDDLIITCYPNPAKTETKFYSSKDISGDIFIFDNNYRFLEKIQVLNKNEIEVDLSKYTSGTYYFQFKSREKLITKKVIKI